MNTEPRVDGTWAASPEAYLRMLVATPGVMVLPPISILPIVEGWKKTGWFDVQTNVRGGASSIELALNETGVAAMKEKGYYAVSTELDLEFMNVADILKDLK